MITTPSPAGPGLPVQAPSVQTWIAFAGAWVACAGAAPGRGFSGARSPIDQLHRGAGEGGQVAGAGAVDLGAIRGLVDDLDPAVRVLEEGAGRVDPRPHVRVAQAVRHPRHRAKT